MTDRKKKRRSAAPSGYRKPPALPEPAPRRGILDGLFPSRVPGVSPMPRLRTSFARGFVVTISTPVLVLGVPLLLLAGWLLLVAVGFQGPFTVMTAMFAVPPVGSLQDLSLASGLWGGSGTGSLIAVFGLGAIRALLLSAVATIAVERCRSEAVSSWSARRVLRVFPFAFMANILCVSGLIAGQIPASLLGPGLGLAVFLGVIIAGVYLLGSVPAIAADEDRGLTETFRRSVQIGRLPSSGSLTLAVIYVVASYAILVARLPGSEIGVNPGAAAWLLAIGINIVNVAVAATFAFRYLSVEAVIPDPVVRTRASTRR